MRGERDVEEAKFASGILVAAGSATRMRGIDKKFARLGGKTVLERSAAALCSCEGIGEVVVVTREQDVKQVEKLLAGLPKLRAIVAGGGTRQESVQRGIAAADPGCGYYVIHDGARPLVGSGDIGRCLEDARAHGAAALCAPLNDTIKERGADGEILCTRDRSRLFACQTPQIFEAGRYREAARRAEEQGEDYTDDCQLFEAAGYPVYLTVSARPNPKITTPEDLALAKALLGEEERAMRMGHGYDVHRLVEGRRLVLGGVEIPHGKGLLGHSDADVLLHAVMDSVLGALALGDIGTLFPDTDISYKDADSMKLLAAVCARMEQEGYRLGNLDVTVAAQAPKLKPYISKMRENLSAVFGTAPHFVSVKATTEEGLGFTGREEGISATAVCLLVARG